MAKGKSDLTVNLDVNADQARAAIDGLWDDVVKGVVEQKRKLEKALGSESKIVTQVVVETDPSSGKEIVKVLEKEIFPITDKLVKQYEKLNATQEGSLTKLRQQVNQAKQVRDSLASTITTVDQYGKKVQVANSEWVKANERVIVLSKALQQAGASNFWDRLKVNLNFDSFLALGQGISQTVNIFQSLAIVIQQVTGTINTFTNALKQIQSINLSFEAIGQGSAGAATALAESSRIALNLGVDLKTTREGFQKLSPAVLAAGGSIDDVSKITQTLSSRFAVYGKSADEAKRITNGIIQAFGKGKLQAEELNQQISEADPAFRTDLASALRVSSSALNELVKNGELTADVLITTLPLLDKSAVVYGKLGDSALDSVAALAKGDATIQQVQSRIQSLNQLSLEAFATQFKGLTGTILGIEAAFADFFSALSKSEIIKTIGLALQAVGQTIVVTVNLILSLVNAFVQALNPILSVVNAFLRLEIVLNTLSVLIGVFAASKLASFIGATIAATTALKAKIAAVLGLSAAQTTATASTTAFNVAQLATGSGITSLISTLGSFSQKALGAFTTPITPIKSFKAGIDSVIERSKVLNAAYSGAGTAAVQRYARTGGEGMSEFGKKVAAARQEIDAKKGAVAGLGGSVKDLIKGFGAFALVSAAVFAVAQAFNTYLEVTKAARDETERAKKTIEDQNDALRLLGVNVKESAGSFQETADRIGVFNAAIDKLKLTYQSLPAPIRAVLNVLSPLGAALNTATAEESSLRVETEATLSSFDQFKQKTGTVISEFEKFAQASDGSAASQIKLNNAYTAAVAPIDANIAAYKSRITALEQSKFQDENARLAAQTQINVLKGLVGQLQAQRSELNNVANAYGIVTTAANSNTDALGAQAEKSKALAEEIKKINQPRIDELKEQLKTEVEAIEAQKEKVKEKYEAEKVLLEERKEALSDSYEVEKVRLEDLKLKTQEKYDAEIKAIEKVRDAENDAYDARIKALQADSPAERRLQELEIAELRKTAAQGETEQERLRAQAQLDRIAKEQQIDQIKEEQAANDRRREEQLKAKQEERENALKRLEEERRQAEREHRAKMEGILDQIASNTKSQKKEEAELDEQILQKRKEFLPEIERLEGEIKKAIDNSREAQKLFNTATGEQVVEQDKVRRKLLEQKQILEDMAKIKLPKFGAFAGGPITGGTRTVVNELGKEAFLSSSGKLSWINAPAWGEWTAPGSGTIIPAHIAAGLNIPSGGASIGRGAGAAVSASRGSNPIARALGAIANSAGGGRVTNNVTIQSANPTQSASDILVTMTKIKRNRYR